MTLFWIKLETDVTGWQAVCHAKIRLVEKKKGRKREQYVCLEVAPGRPAHWSAQTDSPWSAHHKDIYIEVARRALPGMIAERVAEMVATGTE